METISWNFSQYKEYIAKIKNLEVTNYQLDRLHDELSRKRTQSELQIKNLSAPVPPPNLESVGESLRNGGIFAIVGAILGFILGFIIWAFGGKGFLYNFEHGRDVPIGPYLFTGIIAIATAAFSRWTDRNSSRNSGADTASPCRSGRWWSAANPAPGQYPPGQSAGSAGWRLSAAGPAGTPAGNCRWYWRAGHSGSAPARPTPTAPPA